MHKVLKRIFQFRIFFCFEFQFLRYGFFFLFLVNIRSVIGLGLKRIQTFFYVWGAPPHNSGCFWVESLQPTGYLLVTVSESGSQNSQIPGKNPKKFQTNRYTANVYKIVHISKTKNCNKKKAPGLKNLFQNIEHLVK